MQNQMSTTTAKATTAIKQHLQTTQFQMIIVGSNASITTWADGNEIRLAHAIFALVGKKVEKAGEPAIYIANHYNYAVKILDEKKAKTMILNNENHQFTVERIINVVQKFRNCLTGEKRITIFIENGRYIHGTSLYVETELYEKLKKMGCRIMIGYDYVRSLPTLSEYSQRTYLFSTYRLASEAYFVEDGFEDEGGEWKEKTIITAVRDIQDSQRKPERYMIKGKDGQFFSHAIFIDDDSAPEIKLSTERYKIDPDHEKEAMIKYLKAKSKDR